MRLWKYAELKLRLPNLICTLVIEQFTLLVDQTVAPHSLLGILFVEKSDQMDINELVVPAKTMLGFHCYAVEDKVFVPAMCAHGLLMSPSELTLFCLVTFIS